MNIKKKKHAVNLYNFFIMVFFIAVDWNTNDLRMNYRGRLPSIRRRDDQTMEKKIQIKNQRTNFIY